MGVGVTLAERAITLFDGGMTWAEVAQEMGISRTAAKNAGYYWRNRERVSKESRERYANDPEYRAKKLESSRNRDPEAIKAYRRRPGVRERNNARKRNNPEYKARENARRQERYANDSEYRETQKARAAEYRDANLEAVRARSRERYQDPEFRAARLEYQHDWYANGGADLQRVYRAEHREQTAATMKVWHTANIEHLRQYRRDYREANRPRLLQQMSEWRFGPEWGPVHRALCDLRAKLREGNHE